MDPTTSATSLLRQLGASLEAVPFQPAAPGAAPTVEKAMREPAAGHPHDDGVDKTHCYRTIWLSDIHLGSSGCQAEYLLDFLRHNESEYLYLVGDIIDGWQLRKGWYWPQVQRRRLGRKPFGARRNARRGASDRLLDGDALFADPARPLAQSPGRRLTSARHPLSIPRLSMKIMIVTDAWAPQINGVVRTLKNTTRELASLGQ